MNTELLTVRTYGDPILRQVAAPVEVFDQALRRLLDRMALTMDTAGGMGLAGNQVGALLRVFTWRHSATLSGSCVNPRVVWASERTEVVEEGCMSFPRGFRFAVDRPVQATVHYQDGFGKPHQMMVSDRLARTFLHEMDHLDGVVFLDRLSVAEKARADQLIAAGALLNIPQPYEAT